jgi:hypothetical protein
MRRGIILAWLAGEGIIIYRAWKRTHAPPMPGELLIVSGLFVGLALIGEISDDAARFATLMGAGLDIAAFMNLLTPGAKAAGPRASPAPAAGSVRQHNPPGGQ